MKAIIEFEVKDKEAFEEMKSTINIPNSKWVLMPELGFKKGLGIKDAMKFAKDLKRGLKNDRR